jgi:hypothetical protein
MKWRYRKIIEDAFAMREFLEEGSNCFDSRFIIENRKYRYEGQLVICYQVI